MPASQNFSPSPSDTKKLIEIRPKGILLHSHTSPLDHKRKRHAQTQKHQRDRMKAALEVLANTLEAQGVGATGTRAEVVELAVEYILELQRELEGLRDRDSDRSESP
ncbi:hypothetical protein ASPCAL08398 [Aspergillus calidoustus]|uniref:BHLH domain-containing protein n=1 Tax=Aspergillus calidoustus TaxID=454130 RepID=A0A0U5GQ84_ASPCI|nr:hypothetical protein ASPCAL08398 [Aspergillus calidoustus]